MGQSKTGERERDEKLLSVSGRYGHAGSHYISRGNYRIFIADSKIPTKSLNTICIFPSTL